MLANCSVDADDFLAMKVPTVRVRNQQNGIGLGLQTNSANCVPSLLAAFVYTVQADKAAWVFENQRSQFK